MNMDWTWNTLQNCLQTPSKKLVQRCRLYSFPPFPGWNRTSHTRTNIMHGHSSKLYPTTLVAVFSGSKYVGSSSPVGKFKLKESTNLVAPRGPFCGGGKPALQDLRSLETTGSCSFNPHGFCSWIVSAYHGYQKTPKCIEMGFFRENLIVFLVVVLRDCEKTQR